MNPSPFVAMIKKPAHWLFRHAVRYMAPKFTIGVTAILMNPQGEVYVQKHRFWPKQAWGFPGGFLDHGESPQEGVLREISEETRLTVSDLRLIAVQNASDKHQNLYFKGTVDSTEGFKLQRLEVIEGRFVHPDNLPEPFLRAHGSFFEAHREELTQ